MPSTNIQLPNESNEEYYQRLEASLRELFEKAKEVNELQFAFSLAPEFRGCQGSGWNTADEAKIAFDEYMNYLNNGEEDSSFRVRIALSFYSHISEASGFYEIPKNMLRVAEGNPYVMWPFQDLVQQHRISGNLISPNSNKVLRDLVGHAETIGLHELALCFKDAFIPELRNAYAHADYIIWEDGIRLRNRNGGYQQIICWEDFNKFIERGLNFFSYMEQIVNEYIQSYCPPKTIQASLGNSPIENWTISFTPESGGFSIGTGNQ